MKISNPFHLRRGACDEQTLNIERPKISNPFRLRKGACDEQTSSKPRPIKRATRLRQLAAIRDRQPSLLDGSTRIQEVNTKVGRAVQCGAGSTATETEAALRYSATGSGPYVSNFRGKRGLLGCFSSSDIRVCLDGTELRMGEGRAQRTVDVCGAKIEVDHKKMKIRVLKTGRNGRTHVVAELRAADETMTTLWRRLLTRASLSIAGLHYRDGKVLGEGAFGKVVESTDVHSGHVVATKVLDMSNATDDDRSIVNTEVRIGMKVRHRNIVRCVDVFESAAETRIVMEKMDGGSLGDVINNLETDGRVMDEDVAKTRMRDLLLAVEYLHDRGIVHRDLKPDNCLLSNAEDPHGCLKVADFGLAYIGKDQTNEAVCTSEVGTPIYMAPEIYHSAYGSAADMWSCGVILYVMLSGGKVPFRGSTPLQYRKNTKWRKPDMSLEMLPLASDAAKDLIVSLLQARQSRRLTATHALRHRWFVGD